MGSTQKELTAFIINYQQNPCFHAIADDIASRRRHHRCVSVDRQMKRLEGKGHSFSRKEVIGAMRLFDELGLSSFLGRGTTSRMEWGQ